MVHVCITQPHMEAIIQFLTLSCNKCYPCDIFSRRSAIFSDIIYIVNALEQQMQEKALNLTLIYLQTRAVRLLTSLVIIKSYKLKSYQSF